MLNFGLKDTRKKPLIISEAISLLSNGSSSVSMVFENLEYLNLESSGESNATLLIVSNFNLRLESSGSSEVLGDIDRSVANGQDIFEFDSIITKNIITDSEIEVVNENNSLINTILTFKSEVDDL